MNAPLVTTPRVEAFFFDADPGTRFCLYHAPAPQVPARGAILYVHPFAEELNRARRMASLMSRRFAAMGYAVLQIDLFGCGDSCGDFSAARWALWKRDLATARAWLAERSPGPMHLWGLRLGGLLALDCASAAPVDGIVLWQPFLNGHTCISQYLRQSANPRANPAVLRARLLAHGSIEAGGYELCAPLVAAIDACDAATFAVPPCPIHWFASASPSPRRLAASASRLAARWARHGATLHVHRVEGLAFWGSDDLPDCPALLDATGALMAAPLP